MLLHYGLRYLLETLDHDVPELEHVACPHRRWGAAPLPECILGSLDSHLDLGLRRPWNLGQQLKGCWVDDLLQLGAAGLNPLAIDVVFQNVTMFLISFLMIIRCNVCLTYVGLCDIFPSYLNFRHIVINL
jgi:hypothetical protein